MGGNHGMNIQSGGWKSWNEYSGWWVESMKRREISDSSDANVGRTQCHTYLYEGIGAYRGRNHIDIITGKVAAGTRELTKKEIWQVPCHPA